MLKLEMELLLHPLKTSTMPLTSWIRAYLNPDFIITLNYVMPWGVYAFQTIFKAFWGDSLVILIACFDPLHYHTPTDFWDMAASWSQQSSVSSHIWWKIVKHFMSQCHHHHYTFGPAYLHQIIEMRVLRCVVFSWWRQTTIPTIIFVRCQEMFT